MQSQALAQTIYVLPLGRSPTISGMGVGKRIRAVRTAMGLAQGRLAKLAGIPQSTLSSIEHGDSKTPRGDHLVALAAVLRVDQDWLITGHGLPVQRMQPDIDESEMLQLYADLSQANRLALLATAKALLGSQPTPTPASPLRRETKHKR